MEKSSKERLLAQLQMPPLALKGCAQIELMGNKSAAVEGCRGILEYSSEKILLSLGSSCLKFTGSQLEIQSFDSESALVSGEIITVEFC